MKLHELTEGLIKLPGATPVLYKFFLETFFALLGSSLESVDEDDREMALSTYHKLLRAYQVSEPSTAKKRATIGHQHFEKTVKLDIPSEYMKRYDEQYIKAAVKALRATKVTLLIVLDDHPELGPREQALFDPNINRIIISLAKNDIGIDDALAMLEYGLLTKLKDALDTTLGDLEHELTHAVQLTVLHQLHDKQIDDTPLANHSHEDAVLPNGKNHPFSKDSYFNQNLERSPWIRTSLSRFKVTLAGMTRNKATLAEKKAALAKFVCANMTAADLKREVDTPPEASEFFAALKRWDVPAWQRAVKYFTKEIDL